MIHRLVLLTVVVSCAFSVPTVFAREMPKAPAFLSDIQTGDDLKNLSADKQKELAAYQKEVSSVNAGISSLQLLSCSSEKLSGQGSEFSFSPAEKIVFKCQVKNAGTSSAAAFLMNKITPDSAKDESFSSVSGYVGEVAAGATAAFDVTFLSPVLPGKYQYDVSLVSLDDFGMPSKPVGQVVAYVGSLGAGDASIVSAGLDKEGYQWGEQGTLKVTVSKADPVWVISMDGLAADGHVCVNIANNLFVTQAESEYRFALPAEKPGCDIKTIKVSLLTREGFPLDSKIVSGGSGKESGSKMAATAGEPDTRLSVRYGIAGIVALTIIALIAIIIVKRKRSSGHVYGIFWLFGLVLWGISTQPVSAAVTQTIGITAATYTGTEQTLEAINISGMLSKAGSNGGVTGEVQEANSYYQFRATNGTYFTINGTNIGSTLTVVHWRDGLGFASYACDWSNCSFMASYGRGGGATVGVVSATTVGGVSSNYAVFGGAFNGGEQVIEATNISWGMTLAGGNGGVSGESRYRYSYYQFIATNGVRFTLDGVDIGTTITIVHKQDWVGVARNLCTIFKPGGRAGFMVDDSGCSYIATWGRWNRTIGIVAPPVPVVPVVPPAVPADPPLIRATPAVDIKVNGSDTPLSMVPYGNALTISWTTIEADTCTASGPGWTGPKAVSGSETITATADAAYTLTCTNIVGPNSDSVNVTLVPLAVTLTVNGSATPGSILSGTTVPIAWSSPAATSCEVLSGYNWAGSNNTRPASGTDSVVIGATSDYSIRCTGAGAATKTVHVDAVCTPSTGTWGACDCATETKSRTDINASCIPFTTTDVCAIDEKNSCRDFNWKEVKP